jgi:hypothetical protein
MLCPGIVLENEGLVSFASLEMYEMNTFALGEVRLE